ncbi:MAG: GNAT family N-acetyltransferase [Acidobacteriota bacterium]
MTTTIRRLLPSDAEAYVALRRRALDAEPFAFGASPADDSAVSLEVTRRRFEPDDPMANFGAFASELIGTAGLFRIAKAKESHKVFVWGVYVDPAYQGAGLGRQLVETAIAHARQVDGVDAVHLTVTESQHPAIHLYERLGFVCWGVEPDALRWQGRSVARHHMMLRL